MAKNKSDIDNQQVIQDQALAPKLEAWMKIPSGARVKRCQRWWRSGPRAGQQCGKPAVREASCCKTHGGGNARRIGPANPNWKGGATTARLGRYAPRLGQPQQDVYLRALRDPQILSLEDEIALVDVRLDEYARRAGGAFDPEAVHASWQEVKAALSEPGDRQRVSQALTAHEATIRAGADTEKAWAALVKLTDRRRSLVESERQRLREANMFMSREQAAAWAAAIVEIIARHVQDPDVLHAIMSDWRLVMDATRAPAQPERETIDITPARRKP